MTRKIMNAIFPLALFTSIFISMQGLGDDQGLNSYISAEPFNLSCFDEEFAIISPFTEELGAISAAVLKDWDETLRDLEGILDFENIFDSSNLIQSNEKVERALEKLNDYEKRYDQVIAKMNCTIKATNLENENLRTGLIIGFKLGIASHSRLIHEYFKVERSIMQVYRAALDLFITADGFFQLSEDGRLIFIRESDMEMFHFLVQEFHKVASEEQKILQQLGKRSIDLNILPQ